MGTLKVTRTAGVALTVLALAGCAITAPRASSSSVSNAPSSSSNPAASDQPSAGSTSAPDGDVADDLGPVPSPEGPVPSMPPVPARWTDSELVGACKVAWNESGQGGDWGAYSSDATIEKRDSSWYVSFSSESRASRSCLVSGEPQAPQVAVSP